MEVGRVEAGVEGFDELSDEASAMRAMAERPEVVSLRACPPVMPLLVPTPPVGPTILLRFPAYSGAVVNEPMLSCCGSVGGPAVACPVVSETVAAVAGLCASPASPSVGPSRDGICAALDGVGPSAVELLAMAACALPSCCTVRCLSSPSPSSCDRVLPPPPSSSPLLALGSSIAGARGKGDIGPSAGPSMYV